ncbi:hypothetical protein EV363DRAFT_1393093 [Boletus edulis]|uniref:Uncharacterized protein n=1 Tax=Boletus edulis BED1 TaxID=1328754 RepID=A0AAD4GIF5_BOLED|nr:hypothetical protein EV363DRAFT_1393093 [Boletus edulis]KAF8446024.1 hypothetical protein L210DRAFT_3528919 [Boletus edulis BED1]
MHVTMQLCGFVSIFFIMLYLMQVAVLWWRGTRRTRVSVSESPSHLFHRPRPHPPLPPPHHPR